MVALRAGPAARRGGGPRFRHRAKAAHRDPRAARACGQRALSPAVQLGGDFVLAARVAVAFRSTFDAGALAPLLDLPEALLRETGLFLIAYTALVGWLGTRQSMPKVLVMIVIAGNAAWTLASIALLFSGAVTPNILGEAFVVAQAIATGVLAELQYIGLRKSGGALAA